MATLPEEDEFGVSEQGVEEKPASADPADSCRGCVTEEQTLIFLHLQNGVILLADATGVC